MRGRMVNAIAFGVRVFEHVFGAGGGVALVCVRVVRAESGAEAAAVQTLRECGGLTNHLSKLAVPDRVRRGPNRRG